MDVQTHHLTSLPKGMIGRKIKIADVVLADPVGTDLAVTTYKEGYRVRLNSRQARQLRRNGTLT